MKRTMVSIIVIAVGLFTMILIMFSIPLKVTFINVAMAQAVPLIPLTSGNVTLDTGIPKFYKCIEKEVKGSKAVTDDPYFKSEPTKDEVFKCYYAVFGRSIEKAVN
jgi:hypothetical protein